MTAVPGQQNNREEQGWRVGRKVGRTIYSQLGSEPDDTDPLIGVMDTPELALAAVSAHNERPPIALHCHDYTCEQADMEIGLQMARKLEAQMCLRTICEAIALPLDSLSNGWKASLPIILARLETIAEFRPVSVPGGQPDEEEVEQLIDVFAAADFATGRSPCFMPCGKDICRDHGCIHVYQSERKEVPAMNPATGQAWDIDDAADPTVTPGAPWSDRAPGAASTSSDEATVREALKRLPDYGMLEASSPTRAESLAALAALSGALQEARVSHPSTVHISFYGTTQDIDGYQKVVEHPFHAEFVAHDGVIMKIPGHPSGVLPGFFSIRVVQAVEGRVAELTAALTEQAMAMEEIGQYEFARSCREALAGHPTTKEARSE